MEFLFTEIKQEEYEGTIKELHVQEEMMVKLKSEMESYPKALEGELWG